MKCYKSSIFRHLRSECHHFGDKIRNCAKVPSPRSILVLSPYFVYNKLKVGL